MNYITHVSEIAASLGDFEFDSGTDLVEVVKIASVIRISTKIAVERQEEEPDSGDLFTMFKPATLRNAFKEAKEISSVTPEKAVGDCADEWLSSPFLKASASRRSNVLAYRSASEKVVDRVEVNKCDRCQGSAKQRQVFIQKKSKRQLREALFTEAHILLQFLNDRAGDFAKLSDRNYLNLHPEFTPISQEPFEREIKAATRARILIGRVYEI